jgi:hypothetical protein
MNSNIRYEKNLQNGIKEYEAKSESIDVRGPSEILSDNTFEIVPY